MFTQTKKTTKYQIMPNRAFIPRIFIAQEALSKMELYVKECSDEIGWLGTAVEVDGDIHILDTFLLKQDVHATTTEITPEGLAELAGELLSLPDGADTWNNMRMWGHSHVNMGTSPSGQDDKQMREFEDIGHEWFIRLIANKKGDIRLDFYNYAHGVTVLDMEWEYLYEETEHTTQYEQLMANMRALEEQMESVQFQIEQEAKARTKAFEPVVKEEIKQKVKKKVYASYTSKASKTPSTNYGRTQQGLYQQYLDNQFYGSEDQGHFPFQREDDVFLDEKYGEKDFVANDSQLMQFFTHEEIHDLAKCMNMIQVENLFEDHGFVGTFTQSEAKAMWNQAKSFSTKYKGA